MSFVASTFTDPTITGRRYWLSTCTTSTRNALVFGFGGARVRQSLDVCEGRLLTTYNLLNLFSDASRIVGIGCVADTV